MSEQAIMGIDSNSYGFAWVLHRNRSIAYGVHKADGDATTRRLSTFKYARDLFEGLAGPAHVFLEEALILPTNTETTRKLVMMAGTIEAAFWQASPDAHLWQVSLSTWRKSVLGKGGGKKEEMKARATTTAREWLGRIEANVDSIHEIVADDNLCDACCVAMYGLGVEIVRDQ